MTTGWGAPRRMRSLSACLCAVDGMTVMHNLVHGENTLRSLSASAVRSHPFSIYCRGDTRRHRFFLRSCLWILLSVVFFFPAFLRVQMSHCTIVFFFFFLNPGPLFFLLLALLALFREWAGWEAPDWLQVVLLPGLTSRHCFCPLNRINKSMCQVDCSQETMTQFWHHCRLLSPFPPLLPHCRF